MKGCQDARTWPLVGHERNRKKKDAKLSSNNCRLKSKSLRPIKRVERMRLEGWTPEAGV